MEIGAKLSCFNEASEQVFVPIEVLLETLELVCQIPYEASFSRHVLLSRRVRGFTPAFSPELSLSLLFFLYFSFPSFHLKKSSGAFPSSFFCVVPHGTQGNNGSLTTFAESLWTSWPGNVNGKTTQNVSFPFLHCSGSGLLIPQALLWHNYYASRAAYDLAPVKLALTWVIWH